MGLNEHVTLSHCCRGDCGRRADAAGGGRRHKQMSPRRRHQYTLQSDEPRLVAAARASRTTALGQSRQRSLLQRHSLLVCSR